MADTSILHWIRRNKPARLRLHFEGGEAKELQAQAQSKGRWTSLEHAILSLAPGYVEAIDVEGNVIATKTFDVEKEAEVAAATPTPAVSPTDPMGALVTGLPTIVQLMVDASDAAAQRHAEAYRLAFEQQLALVKVLADRLHGLEKAYQSVLMSQAQQQGGGDSDALVAQVLGHAMSNGAGAATATKPKETPQ